LSVAVITHPIVDLKTLAEVFEQCLDKSPLRDVDGSIGSLKHYTSLVDKLKPGYADVLTHIGVLVAMDELDMVELIEVLGVPHISIETKFRGVSLVYFVGSKRDFHGAFTKACSEEVKKTLQEISYRIGGGRI